MNKILMRYSTLVMCLITSLNSFSQMNAISKQEYVETNHAFTVYPFSFVASSIQAGFELRIRKSQFFKIIAAYGVSDNNDNNYYDAYTFKIDPFNTDQTGRIGQFNTLNIQGQYRFNFFNKSRPANRFFMGPFVQYKKINFDELISYYVPGTGSYNEVTKRNASCLGLGYIFGYQLRDPSGFLLEFYAGGGLQNSTTSSNIIPSNFIDPYKKGIFFHPGLSLGFQF